MTLRCGASQVLALFRDRDATELFEAMHSPAAKLRLQTFLATGETVAVDETPMQRDLRYAPVLSRRRRRAKGNRRNGRACDAACCGPTCIGKGCFGPTGSSNWQR